MGRRATFGQTWLRVNLDLEEFDLDPFNIGMTAKQRWAYTFGVFAIALGVLAFLDAFASIWVLVAGVWAIWNPGNKITKTERKIFLSVLAGAVYFGLLSKVTVFLQALLPWTIVLVVFLVVLWRK